LKIGTLLPATGDLASVGQPMLAAVPLLVDEVNACGGVNGKPITLITADDQTDQAAGVEAMTKLVEVDKVAGVVGSFASGVSGAAVNVAVRGKVMMISPGSTSPVLTDRAKKGEFDGFWARTAPPDTYQAKALARLASEKGLKNVATIAINNDYGIAFEQEFVKAFKALGGTITNESNPTRYDPKATTFETEVRAAFGGKPNGVAAVLYAETGSLVLKAAYQQNLLDGVTVLLTDGVYADDFPVQVGKNKEGKFILGGAIGTVPGAGGKDLATFTKFWEEKQKRPMAPYVPHSWDAAALLVLSAQASGQNTGEGIKSKLRDVANAPGEEVSDVCKALELLKAGKDINYQGMSGSVDIDEYGDVSGVYDIWQVEADGKLKVTGQVKP
jgi:neutral amino acid transport system substrate-binding protein